jgi:hypothetical protein
MADTWATMSGSEKIEDLRRDLLKTISFVNQLNAHSDVLERGISEVSQKLSHLESQVVKLAPLKPEERPRSEKGHVAKPRRHR